MSQLLPHITDKNVEDRIQFLKTLKNKSASSDVKRYLNTLKFLKNKRYAESHKMKNNVDSLRDILGLSGVVFAGAVLGGLFGCALGCLLGGPAGGAVGLAVGIAIGALLTNTLALECVMIKCMKEEDTLRLLQDKEKLIELESNIFNSLTTDEDRQAFVKSLGNEEIKVIYDKLGYINTTTHNKTKFFLSLNNEAKKQLFFSLDGMDKQLILYLLGKDVTDSVNPLKDFLKLLDDCKIKDLYDLLNSRPSLKQQFVNSLDKDKLKSLYEALKNEDEKCRGLVSNQLEYKSYKALYNAVDDCDKKTLLNMRVLSDEEIEDLSNCGGCYDKNEPALKAELNNRKSKTNERS